MFNMMYDYGWKRVESYRALQILDSSSTQISTTRTRARLESKTKPKFELDSIENIKT